MSKNWLDQRARLKEALDALDDRMADPEVAATELAAVARERRITLNELVLLGEAEAEVSNLDEIQARRAKRLAGE
jgi:hypothetical protein